MKQFINLVFCLFLSPSILVASTTPAQPIAEVVKMRGEVTQLSPGARMARKVEMGEKFLEDTSIVTGPKSFIKIKFIDQSEINLGSESKIVISEMKLDSPGIISLLKGRIRAEVQKNAGAPTVNKFFIKTRTAAMGVRGTEFQTIYNPENKITSLLTFKGEVAMAKVDEKTYDRLENAQKNEVVRDELTKEVTITQKPLKKLDEVEELNKVLKSQATVLVPSGQNSFSSDSLKKSSLPVKISPLQLEVLYKDRDLKEKDAAQVSAHEAPSIAQKSSLKVASQSAPAEGLVNEKTGDFAPRSGGFIDLATGLYVAPNSDAKLDAASGVYVADNIGGVDADTGQYIAPKGLVLDAKKGFILAEESGKGEVKPELLAMKEDLNKNIAKDAVVGFPKGEALELAFNINEKFIRDRLTLSVWGFGQNLSTTDNSTAPYFERDSKDAVRLSLDWQMASNNRFSPLVGIDYSSVNFDGVSQDSKKLMGLSFGVQYAWLKNVNLYGKFGLHQDHYLDQVSSGTSNLYQLRKVVITRLSFGANAEFWRKNKFSLDASAGALMTFRKRINNLVVKAGTGMQLELLPKLALSDRKWLGLGFKTENQVQRNQGTAATNKVKRNSSGIELKYISDF